MTEQKEKWNFKPVIGLALVSLLICGLFYPFLITGIGQVFFPNQANGDLVQLNGQTVGSNLIAQNFTLQIFFHTRNETNSASGVDPDITLQDAYSQIPGICNATNIPETSLTNIVNQNQEGTFWIFGNPYVNVLRINLLLIKDFPSTYGNFSG
ncbi:MAG TPA: potassium-transporting ATPase subunit C [Candidatus Acidoferrum sp.]|nr:potassium-transporting ATPase subunit C [Candidatus Acidoferrum sp.]